MPDRDIHELLKRRDAGSLSEDQRRELSELIAQHPEFEDLDAELAAAASSVAMLEPAAEMPRDLYKRVAADAARYYNPEADAVRRRKEQPRSSPWRWSGWAAATACLVLALTGVIPNVLRDAPDPLPQRLAKFAAANEDVMRIAWTATEDELASKVGGEVLWSPSLQRGFMVFDALPDNDPQANQYQLWIFDAERDDRFPVDGGVFDSRAGSRLIVPITAKLPVTSPALFAVTYEPAGGVVVSDRSRIVTLAKP